MHYIQSGQNPTALPATPLTLTVTPGPLSTVHSTLSRLGVASAGNEFYVCVAAFDQYSNARVTKTDVDAFVLRVGAPDALDAKFVVQGDGSVCSPVKWLKVGDLQVYALFNSVVLSASPFNIRIDPLPAPGVKEIRFADSLGRLTVLFTEDTNQGSVGVFPCHSLFTPDAGQATMDYIFGPFPTCVWVSPTKMEVWLGKGSPIVVGALLKIDGDRPANTNATNNEGVRLRAVQNRLENSFVLKAQAPVLFPHNPPPIGGVLQGFDVVGTCGTIHLDASDSTAAGGRELSYSWGLMPRNPPNTNEAAITSALAAFGGQKKVELSAQLFQPDEWYTVLVRLKDFLGQVQDMTKVFKTTEESPPNIFIFGPGKRQLDRSRDITLMGPGSLPSCGNSTGNTLLFNWTIVSTDHLFPLNERTKNARALLLPTTNLHVGRVYDIQLAACLGSKPSLCGSAVVQLLVTAQPVTARIVGGSRLVSFMKPLVLDATASSDPDWGSNCTSGQRQPTDSCPCVECATAWTAVWSCSLVDVSINEVVLVDGKEVPCFDDKDGLLFTTQPKLVLPAKTLPAGKSYRFKVVVFKEPGPRSAATFVDITVDPGDPPKIEISTPGAKVNADELVALTGRLLTDNDTVVSPADPHAIYEWGIIGPKTPDFAIQSIDGSPFYALAPESLIPGNAYSVTLRASFGPGATFGSAQVRLVINLSPTSGECHVNPTRGESVVTDFALACAGWTDDPEDLPLSYAWDIIHANFNFTSEPNENDVYGLLLWLSDAQARSSPVGGLTTSLVQKTLSLRNSVVLPEGDVEDEHKVVLRGCVSDTLNGRACLVRRVQVDPFGSGSAVTARFQYGRPPARKLLEHVATRAENVAMSKIADSAGVGDNTKVMMVVSAFAQSTVDTREYDDGQMTFRTAARNLLGRVKQNRVHLLSASPPGTFSALTQAVESSIATAVPDLELVSAGLGSQSAVVTAAKSTPDASAATATAAGSLAIASSLTGAVQTTGVNPGISQAGNNVVSGVLKGSLSAGKCHAERRRALRRAQAVGGTAAVAALRAASAANSSDCPDTAGMVHAGVNVLGGLQKASLNGRLPGMPAVEVAGDVASSASLQRPQDVGKPVKVPGGSSFGVPALGGSGASALAMKAISFTPETSPYANEDHPGEVASGTVGLKIEAGDEEVAVNNTPAPIVLVVPMTIKSTEHCKVPPCDNVERCLFWNNATQSWDGTGCLMASMAMATKDETGKALSTLESYPTSITCHCFHLTDFGSMAEDSIPSANIPDPAAGADAFKDLSLKQFIIIGCLISIVGFYAIACVWGRAKDKMEHGRFIADPVKYVNMVNSSKAVAAMRNVREASAMQTAALYLISEHVLMTIVTARPWSPLSRPQLITIFTCYVVSTATANAVFFGSDPGNMAAGFIISIISSLIVWPSTFLFAKMFENVRRHDTLHRSALHKACLIVDPEYDARMEREAAEAKRKQEEEKLAKKNKKLKDQAHRIASDKPEAVEKKIAEAVSLKSKIASVVVKAIEAKLEFKDPNSLLGEITPAKSNPSSAMPAKLQYYVYFFSVGWMFMCIWLNIFYAVTFPEDMAEAWLVGTFISTVQEVFVTDPAIICCLAFAYYFLFMRKNKKAELHKEWLERQRLKGQAAANTSPVVLQGRKSIVLPSSPGARFHMASVLSSESDLVVSSHLGHVTPRNSSNPAPWGYNSSPDVSHLSAEPSAMILDFAPHADSTVRYLAVSRDDDRVSTQIALTERSDGTLWEEGHKVGPWTPTRRPDSHFSIPVATTRTDDPAPRPVTPGRSITAAIAAAARTMSLKKGAEQSLNSPTSGSSPHSRGFSVSPGRHRPIPLETKAPSFVGGMPATPALPVTPVTAGGHIVTPVTGRGFQRDMVPPATFAGLTSRPLTPNTAVGNRGFRRGTPGPSSSAFPRDLSFPSPPSSESGGPKHMENVVASESPHHKIMGFSPPVSPMNVDSPGHGRVRLSRLSPVNLDSPSHGRISPSRLGGMNGGMNGSMKDALRGRLNGGAPPRSPGHLVNGMNGGPRGSPHSPNGSPYGPEAAHSSPGRAFGRAPDVPVYSAFEIPEPESGRASPAPFIEDPPAGYHF